MLVCRLNSRYLTRRPRLLPLALERIERMRAQSFLVATGRRCLAEKMQFRQDQIKNLTRRHLERTFAEEIRERVRRMIMRDLQDALVHCDDDELRRSAGLIINRESIAGTHHLRRVELDTLGMGRAANREGSGPV